MSKKNQDIIITLLIFVLIALGIYFFLGKEKSGSEIIPTTPKVEKDEPKNGEEKKTEEVNPTNYSLTVNKKDGDIFSIPEKITYTITPNVEKSKITLLNTDGSLLYVKEINGPTAEVDIYPRGKFKENSEGTIIIEGFEKEKSVFNKKIKVLF